MLCEECSSVTKGFSVKNSFILLAHISYVVEAQQWSPMAVSIGYQYENWIKHRLCLFCLPCYGWLLSCVAKLWREITSLLRKDGFQEGLQCECIATAFAGTETWWRKRKKHSLHCLLGLCCCSSPQPTSSRMLRVSLAVLLGEECLKQKPWSSHQQRRGCVCYACSASCNSLGLCLAKK